MRSSPDVATDAARAWVTTLETAMSTLGSADDATLKSLQERPRVEGRSKCVGEANDHSPSFLRLRHATSAVAVAATQVDSGQFNALDEDLGDTEVDEGGDTTNFRESTVNESPIVPTNAMSDAEGPIVGRHRLRLVSQQEVAPTMMDAPSTISRDLLAESNGGHPNWYWMRYNFSHWQCNSWSKCIHSC